MMFRVPGAKSTLDLAAGHPASFGQINKLAMAAVRRQKPAIFVGMVSTSLTPLC